jgi:hypothetical protein
LRGYPGQGKRQFPVALPFNPPGPLREWKMKSDPKKIAEKIICDDSFSKIRTKNGKGKASSTIFGSCIGKNKAKPLRLHLLRG